MVTAGCKQLHCRKSVALVLIYIDECSCHTQAADLYSMHVLLLLSVVPESVVLDLSVLNLVCQV